MTKQTMSLGPVPGEELCQQVGSRNYDPIKAREECVRYIQQLRAEFGEPPEGARFRVRSNPHDFGSYYDVEVEWDGDNRVAEAYAFNVEANASPTWKQG